MCLAVLALFAASVAATGGGELIVRPAAAQRQRQQTQQTLRFSFSVL
jgi:hypothetical protein